MNHSPLCSGLLVEVQLCSILSTPFLLYLQNQLGGRLHRPQNWFGHDDKKNIIFPSFHQEKGTLIQWFFSPLPSHCTAWTTVPYIVLNTSISECVQNRLIGWNDLMIIIRIRIKEFKIQHIFVKCFGVINNVTASVV